MGAKDFPTRTRSLLRSFWPGSVTTVLARGGGSTAKQRERRRPSRGSRGGKGGQSAAPGAAQGGPRRPRGGAPGCGRERPGRKARSCPGATPSPCPSSRLTRLRRYLWRPRTAERHRTIMGAPSWSGRPTAESGRRAPEATAGSTATRGPAGPLPRAAASHRPSSTWVPPRAPPRVRPRAHPAPPQGRAYWSPASPERDAQPGGLRGRRRGSRGSLGRRWWHWDPEPRSSPENQRTGGPASRRPRARSRHFASSCLVRGSCLGRVRLRPPQTEACALHLLQNPSGLWERPGPWREGGTEGEADVFWGEEAGRSLEEPALLLALHPHLRVQFATFCPGASFRTWNNPRPRERALL